MQLVLVFMEVEDETEETLFWETLEAEQHAAVVRILARLMTKIVAPGEKGDE
jgi:hypothetical protein